MKKKYGFDNNSEQKYKTERQDYLNDIARLHNELQIAKR